MQLNVVLPNAEPQECAPAMEEGGRAHLSLATLRKALIARLDEADRGDRGWWLITRVHLSAARLQQTASYLYDAKAYDGLELSVAHYDALASILGIASDNPKQTINRHIFLAMDRPLQLIERTDGGSWSEIKLTAAGVRLATDPDTPKVFEQILSEIRFCREPWFTPDRVQAYSDFDVLPYRTALRVMTQCHGYIDIDEFDLFVSRIRNMSERAGAISAILEFRSLPAKDKGILLSEVEARIPTGKGGSAKPYSNWRDMARHTFSLFALGQSAIRSGNALLLTGTLVEETAEPAKSGSGAEKKTPQTKPASPKSKSTLKLPASDTPDDLLSPPVSPEANSGNEAETLVGKMLAAAGWEVVYYNHRRGYGFDLWAKKDETAFVIEVKSSLAIASSITLTRLEHEAATKHADNYLLVVVENMASEPTFLVVQNPGKSLAFSKIEQTEFRVSGNGWRKSAITAFFDT